MEQLMDDYIQLEAYRQEMQLHNDLTLQKLIDSHRRLRAEANKSQEQKLKELAEIRENAKRLAFEAASSQYIHIDVLKTMTIAEIATLIIC